MIVRDHTLPTLCANWCGKGETLPTSVDDVINRKNSYDMRTTEENANVEIHGRGWFWETCFIMRSNEDELLNIKQCWWGDSIKWEGGG
jgi:hypothetical protein